MNKLQLLIRRWLGIDKIHSQLDAHKNEKHLSEDAVKALVAQQMIEWKEFLKPAPAPAEPRQSKSAPKTWSTFRGKIESLGEDLK